LSFLSATLAVVADAGTLHTTAVAAQRPAITITVSFFITLSSNDRFLSHPASGQHPFARNARATSN
jgi:hypothetical protein